jgi:dienelactone hydrolase
MKLFSRRRVPALALVAILVPALAVAVTGVLPSAGAARHSQPDRGRPGQVSIIDITIRVPHQDPVQAWLVAPSGNARRHTMAGVLWLHWLGQIHNDRSEFLSEAVDLAGMGVVSILPQGYFPWVPDPDGTAGDVTLVRNQVASYRAVLGRLAREGSVDPERIAVVGHDYGAMYGALLADRDHRVSVLAMQAPDSLWGNWFATYWLGLEGQARADYYALFAGLDPVDHVSRLGSHVLFQWAGQDVFVPEEVRTAFTAANPQAESILYPNADHQLTDRGIVDLVAFLEAQLGLGG